MSGQGKAMPRQGRSGEEILAAMREARGGDAAWEDGKVWCLVYHAGEEISGFLKEAYTTYFSENALNPSAFPSLKQMEYETIAMTAHLLGGDAEVQGSMTSGGTESILMAMKAARQWGKANKRLVCGPYEVVLPTTAHPAFEKAAYYFGLKLVRVPVDEDFRADVRAMRRAITRRTVMLVGSAPQYPQGVVDPIDQIGALAQRKGILCHVDACVGGMMLPFVRELGYDVPPFDFRVPGVTSMSVDLHKYGYAAKGASVVLHRNAALRRNQYFVYTDWPGGIYASPSMTGTRPGGAIAAAWAIMHRLGHEGYLEIAREVMDVSVKLRDGVNAIPGVKIMGDPTMSVMAIGADGDLDIYEVGDFMSERGWHLDRQQHPECLHMTINRGHLVSADTFLSDLAEAARTCMRDPSTHRKAVAKMKLLNTVVKLTPSPIVTLATPLATKVLGLGGDGGELPTRSAAMYGMIAALPNRGDIHTLVMDIFDKMTRFDPNAAPILDDTPASAVPGLKRDAEDDGDEIEAAQNITPLPTSHDETGTT